MPDSPTGIRGDGLPLFWRVCLTNGLVFIVGTAVLAVSPATVSSPVVVTEAVVLGVGLAIILIANGILLRNTLAPLDRLIRLMDSVDLLRPGQRLTESGNGAVSQLVTTFNAMLARLEAERSLSNGRALAAQEAERQRIAQELHDEVGQSLTAVVLGLGQVVDQAPEELRGDILQAQETARSSLEEVRRVARRLRPGVLDDLGLLSALSSLASDFGSLTGTSVRRSFDASLPDLPADTELVVYRIAQECLTNVARHAQAGQVTVLFRRHGEYLMLRVEDDGVGMSHVVEGAGIRGMRERALLIDAEVSVTSRLHGGTTVSLLIPMGADSRQT